MSCSLPSYKSDKDSFAPRNIGNSSFTFTHTKTNPDFKSIEGKDLIYYFNTDLTYESFLNDEPYMSGDYAYNQTGPDKGKLAISYTEGADIEYETLHLYFVSATKGKFEAIPYSKDLDLQEGTFTFNPKATMPSSQNAACDKLPALSGNT